MSATIRMIFADSIERGDVLLDDDPGHMYRVTDKRYEQETKIVTLIAKADSGNDWVTKVYGYSKAVMVAREDAEDATSDA